MQRGRYIQFALIGAALTMAGWSLQPAQAAPPAANGLPAGWTAAALGDGDDDPQTVTVADGKWTIEAGGSDLWNAEDGGIIVYQNHTGNGSITARLLSQVDPEDDGWTKTAVGFRETADAGSRVVRLSYASGHNLEPAIRREEFITPSKPGEGSNEFSGAVGFAGNGNDVGAGMVPGAGREIGEGIWFGVDRNGDKFGYYWSNDGKVWTPIGAATIDFPDEVLVGIEATKHSGGELQTSVLDNVSVSNELIAPKAVSSVSWTPRNQSVLVGWNPVAVADGEVTYNVYQIDQTATERKKVNAEPIKTSTFLVEGLTNGEQYRFGVTAVLDGVESGLSVPFPSHGWRGIGVAVPMAPLENGMVLHNIGTNDAGSVTVEGTGRDAKYTFRVGGFDFWEAADGGALLAVPMEGDLDVSLRLLEGPEDLDGDGWAQGGPTFRETLDPGSRMAIAVISAANAMQFKRRVVDYQRPVNTDAFQSSGDNTTRPVSSRIVRKGDTFQAFFSEDDGATWEPMGETEPITIENFAAMPYVGQTWTSHLEGELAEVVVDHFEIKPAQ